MRVMMVLSSLQMGGAERNVVNVLPYLRDEGVDAGLITLGTRPDSSLAEGITENNIERFDIGAKRLLDPAAFNRFVDLVREEEIDLLHAEDQYATLFINEACKRLNLPWVYTRHDEEERSVTINQRIRARIAMRAASRNPARVIAVSEAIRQLFHQQTERPLDTIVTIYNGIPLAKFDTHHMREQKRAELGWGPDELIAVQVAVIRQGKGHDVLFAAAPLVKEALPNVRIMIVGDGPMAEQRHREAAHLTEYVQFMGNRSDVDEILGAADMMIMPSRTEALPTAPIEAGAAALPVVGTDVGGTREIIDDGVTGYVIPPEQPEIMAEKMVEVLSNPDLARRFGEAAQERVHGLFTLSEQAKRTKALYEEVLEEHRVTTP